MYVAKCCPARIKNAAGEGLLKSINSFFTLSGACHVTASFAALTVNLSTQSILHLAPVVQQVQLTKPYVHLVRKQAHRYNIDDIIELVGSQPPSPQPARFSVNN